MTNVAAHPVICAILLMIIAYHTMLLTAARIGAAISGKTATGLHALFGA